MRKKLKDLIVKISRGNTKTGAIPAVSLMPVLTCIPEVPCKKECYDLKICALRKRVLNARLFNTDIWKTKPKQYFEDIADYLQIKSPKLFRFHIGGDIPDDKYLKSMYHVAELRPHTNFLCFTKHHYLVARRLLEKPDNMEIVLSMWPGWGKQVTPLPKAWMQDGTETRIPEDALTCSGLCDACGMCWQLSKIGKDVVFPKH